MERARRGTKSAIPCSKDFDLMALAEPFAVDHPFMPPDTFKDDVILVTGGGTGLGKAMAQMFARHGGRIAIASRKEEHRAAGVAALEALGGTALGVALDIRDPEQVTRAVEGIPASLGPVKSQHHK